MKILLVLMLMLLSSPKSQASMLTEFDQNKNDLIWRVVNDKVMGGRSSGGYTVDGGILKFTGVTNTRGGGFSSIRSVPQRLAVTDKDRRISLRIRGDGRTYTFRVQTRDGVSYWAEFPSSASWEEANVPFSTFQPRWRGMWLDGPVLNPADIVSLGLMIYDKQDGEFFLEVDWIAVTS